MVSLQKLRNHTFIWFLNFLFVRDSKRPVWLRQIATFRLTVAKVGCVPQATAQWANLAASANKKVSFVYLTKETFLSDAFLAEHDAHFVRDTGFACDARLRRVGTTHRITYHSATASLITNLQTG